MGFEFEMIQRVGQLYPDDADAALECLLGGGIPASAVDDTDSMPGLVSPDEIEPIDEWTTGGGAKRRRTSVAQEDVSAVASTSKAVSKPVDSVTSTPKRSTSADVLFEL